MRVGHRNRVVLSVLFGILAFAMVSTLQSRAILCSQNIEINCENGYPALGEGEDCEWLGYSVCDPVGRGDWKRQNSYGSMGQGRFDQRIFLAEEETVKYKRHDKSGGRNGKKSGDKQRYQDRRSRIDREWEGQEADAEKRRRNRAKEIEQKKQFEKKDKELLTQFQNQRQAAWKDRQVVTSNHYRVDDGGQVVKTNLLGKLSTPVASLGARVFWMGEGNDPGPVAATEIDVNLMRHYLRLGFSTLIGVRILPERDDLTFLENISVGISWPSRFSPYLVGRGGVGVMLSDRFGDERAFFLGSMGVEAGLDCWVNSWLDIAPALGYARLMVKGAYWDSFTAKIALGF